MVVETLTSSRFEPFEPVPFTFRSSCIQLRVASGTATKGSRPTRNTLDSAMRWPWPHDHPNRGNSRARRNCSGIVASGPDARLVSGQRGPPSEPESTVCVCLTREYMVRGDRKVVYHGPNSIFHCSGRSFLARHRIRPSVAPRAAVVGLIDHISRNPKMRVLYNTHGQH